MAIDSRSFNKSLIQITIFLNYPLMFNIIIVNKSGGLIYNLYSNEESNHNLILSSSLHTLFAHIMEIPYLYNEETNDPLMIYLENKIISIYKTITGYSFVFVDNNEAKLDLFKKTYELFCDYVLKDPYYMDEMPVNSLKFEFHIKKLLNK